MPKDIWQKNTILPPKLPRLCDQFLLKSKDSKFNSSLLRGCEKSFWYTKLRFGCHDVNSDWRDWSPNEECVHATMGNKGFIAKHRNILKFTVDSSRRGQVRNGSSSSYVAESELYSCPSERGEIVVNRPFYFPLFKVSIHFLIDKYSRRSQLNSSKFRK